MIKTNIYPQKIDTTNYLRYIDYPSSTNLYGWRANPSSGAFVTVYGNKDLTLSGTMTLQNDHLGNARYCGQNSTHQYHTASAFVGTGSFNLLIRAKRASWSAAVTETLVSNAINFSTNGDWQLVFNGGILRFSLTSGGSVIHYDLFDCTMLGASYYHTFVFSYTSGDGFKLHVDGSHVRKFGTSVTIAADAQKFQISGYNGTNNRWSGDISEVWLQTGTGLSLVDAEKIYLHGSRKEAYLDEFGIARFIHPLDGVVFRHPLNGGQMVFEGGTTNPTKGSGYSYRGDWYTTFDGGRRCKCFGTCEVGGYTSNGVGTIIMKDIFPLSPYATPYSNFQSLLVHPLVSSATKVDWCLYSPSAWNDCSLWQGSHGGWSIVYGTNAPMSVDFTGSYTGSFQWDLDYRVNT